MFIISCGFGGAETGSSLAGGFGLASHAVAVEMPAGLLFFEGLTGAGESIFKVIYPCASK